MKQIVFLMGFRMRKLNAILLVDDDQITNFINKRLIKKLEVADDIQVALNGEEALNLIKKCQKEEVECPDVIFLDINMPVTDGFGFLKAFEGMDVNKDVNVIVLTTSSNPKDIKNLESYQIKGFLNKPLTEEKVKEVIEEL
ncbi:response regulator [Cytophagaceae bacterium ABcell3]|nr:response regulator [Cytophagaceae bacterium ABcell3]